MVGTDSTIALGVLGAGTTATLGVIGAGITAALGVLGVVRPDVAADVVGIRPDGDIGYSEIRATYGGIFLGMGVGCLWLGSSAAYLVVALAWLGAATARVLAVAALGAVSRENAVAVGVETTVGVLVLLGAV